MPTQGDQISLNLCTIACIVEPSSTLLTLIDNIYCYIESLISTVYGSMSGFTTISLTTHVGCITLASLGVTTFTQLPGRHYHLPLASEVVTALRDERAIR